MFTNEPFGGLIPGAQGAVLAALLRTNKPLTGREVHRLVSDRARQQTVQRALHVLVQLGIVTSTKAGSAYLYVLNEDHIAVEPLRQLASPLELVRRVIAGTLDSRDAVTAVVVFGSVARGDSTHTSDVDLLVLADSSWDRRADVKNAVETRFGSTCDVLQYTPGVSAMGGVRG